MSIILPKLPFQVTDLQPHMSKETLEFHYGKHHKKYVETLNQLIAGTDYDALSLEEIILESYQKDDEIFNNAAQSWNHTFFWNCLSAKTPHPTQEVLEIISSQFNSLQEFKFKFNETAAKLFGSGWVWLAKNKSGKLSIESLKDAGTPLTQGQTPILTCDVWEHAYYLDYQNERPKFMKNFWQIVNWDFVEKNLTLDVPRNKYSEYQTRVSNVSTRIHLY